MNSIRYRAEEIVKYLNHGGKGKTVKTYREKTLYVKGKKRIKRLYKYVGFFLIDKIFVFEERQNEMGGFRRRRHCGNVV